MTTQTVANMDLVLDPDLNCKSALVQAALNHWRAIRMSRKMPAPKDLDVLDIPRKVLPHVILLDIEHKPTKRFRWRLIGTAVTNFLQRDLTGGYWDELYAEDDYNLFSEPVDNVLSNGEALRFTAKCHIPRMDVYDAEHIYMPLSCDDHQVDRLFGVSVFVPSQSQKYGIASVASA